MRMGHQFKVDSWKEQMESGGMLQYVSETTNPAVYSVEKLFEKLREDAPIWLSVTGLGDWAADKLHAVIVSQLTVIGHAFMRSIVEFLYGFPWWNGKLYTPGHQRPSSGTPCVHSRCSLGLDKHYTPDLLPHLTPKSAKSKHTTCEMCRWHA